MPVRDNVLDFEADIDAFKRKCQLSLSEALRRIVFELLRRIVIRTPVDTGRAAGSWMVGNSVENVSLPLGTHMS